MANIKSAKKRARQNVRKNDVNHSYISGVRTAIKNFRSAVTEKGNTEDTVAFFKMAQSKLMKAATKGILHKNNAARRVTRLAHLLKTPTKK